MKKFLLLLLSVAMSITCLAEGWPRTLDTKEGARIVIYQPQPEQLKGDKLIGRSAVSARAKATDEPVFGAIWFTATMSTNRDTRIVSLESIVINEVKLPGVTDSMQIKKLKTLLESEIPKWKLDTSLSELSASIEQEQQVSNEEMKNDPPNIIYAQTPSTLVLIDGEPKLQLDENLKMQRVINTPFLILLYEPSKMYYFYGGDKWYASASVLEGWSIVSSLPSTLQPVDAEIKKQQTSKADPKAPKRALIVSTQPAELIQSNGEADFSPIQGTSLLFMINSDNDIFMDINSQKYYVLLSGRWYIATGLKGPWTFVDSDKLPADFGKIPEGSTKDNVLASVSGTVAAKEAVMDAQVPQTAKVDRKTATCTVTYDGEPKFEKIEGTSLELAMNTSSTVIKEGSNYFCVENGVWFKSTTAKGPWAASTERPKETDKIPPSSSAYNAKYVYIYDSTPEVIYVGYTPGYMGCYVYGSTVIYGTGYYYNPWYGPYYYPHAATYGFSMHYNPWTGWGMGFHYSSGFFSVSVHGGYWGPPMYRPPYHHPYHGGMYGRGPTYINGDVNINRDRTNNIYNHRDGVSTNDVKRGQNTPSTRDNRGTGQQGRNNASTQPSKNNVYSDKSGNVYQQNDKGNWQQRDNNQWKDANRNNTNQLDQSSRQRDRSSQGNNSFQQTNRGGNMGGGFSRGGGGGGGGGRRR